MLYKSKYFNILQNKRLFKISKWAGIQFHKQNCQIHRQIMFYSCTNHDFTIAQSGGYLFFLLYCSPVSLHNQEIFYIYYTWLRVHTFLKTQVNNLFFSLSSYLAVSSQA